MTNDKSEAVSNIDIAVYALAILGGVESNVHTEHIAAKCFELARVRFSWVLPIYRGKWPDKEIVRSALEDGKKETNGALVQGKHARDTSKDGWRVTPKGVEWITKNKGRIARALKQKEPSLPKREAERFIKKIKRDQFFKYFQERHSLGDTPQYMFTDMLVCAPDAARNIIKQKFEHVYANAELVGDTEILDFLKACKEKFRDLIS